MTSTVMTIVTLSLMLCSFTFANAQSLKNHFIADSSGVYHVFWETSKDTGNFTVEVQVRSKGYVGFGISPDGKMPGSDAIIGWIYPNGTSVFHDRHALGFYEPLIDNQQNYHLINAYENETHTVLRFTRYLNTCDKDNDTVITDDTTRIIFSWHPDDPPAITGLPYHGRNRRGSKRIYPLSPPPPLEDITDDITIWNVQMPNVTLTAKLTTYWCITVKLPNLTEPHEYVGFKMNITPGNEMLVHHFLFYECVGNNTYFEEQANTAGYECAQQGTVNAPMQCQPAIAAWAIGSEGYLLPKDIGVPVGEQYGGASYYFVQMHYNNVELKAGIVDSTSIMVYLSPKLRPIKGANLQIYAKVDYTIVIPPKQPSFRVTAYCPPECTANAIPTAGITLYAVLLHAHLAGRKISLHHFRGGQELKPISVDNQYDFNYQEMRQLAEPVTILPGDTLMAKCEYSSMDRNTTILGGYGTLDEMCFIYMFYYPAIPLSICIGGPPYQDIYSYFGVESVGPDKYHITAPPNLAGQSIFTYIENYDWNNVSDAKLQQMYSMQYEGVKDFTCISGRGKKDDIKQVKIAYPTNASVYATEDINCDTTMTSTNCY